MDIKEGWEMSSTRVVEQKVQSLDDFASEDMYEKKHLTEDYESTMRELAPYANVGNTQRLIAAKQEGPTCGCYATGMIIESLTDWREEWKKRNVDGEEVVPFDEISVKENDSVQIARAFEDTAKSLGLSSLGEMFSAETLAYAINRFAGLNRANILAKHMEFDTEAKLYRIINLAAQKGVRVMIPYFAGFDLKPTIPAGKERDFGEKLVIPSQMYRAHWTAVNAIDTKSGTVEVNLYEGNNTLNTQMIRLQDLFVSNMSLGSWFDWGNYLKKESETKAPAIVAEERAAVEARKVAFPGPFKAGETGLLEEASLRGKVVLVGWGK